jgi:hypothetical protein
MRISSTADPMLANRTLWSRFILFISPPMISDWIMIDYHATSFFIR